MPESFIHLRTGSIGRSTNSSIIASNLARVSLTLRCLGPLASAVKNGRLMSVSIADESSILAFSAASFRRWSTILSLETSSPVSSLRPGTVSGKAGSSCVKTVSPLCRASSPSTGAVKTQVGQSRLTTATSLIRA